MEVYYAGYLPAETNNLLNLAQKYDLIPTGGTDYHGIDPASEMTIGGTDVPMHFVEKLIALAEQRVLKNLFSVKIGELMEFKFILLAIGAYLLGSVPAAYLAIKWSRGTDIRKVGTGKVGAANVLNAGARNGCQFPSPLFDIGKGVLVVFSPNTDASGAALSGLVGVFAVLGHDWSIYLKFKSGGRGVFVTLGVITMLSWKLGLIALVGPYLLFAPFKQVALGVFAVYVTFPFLAYFFTGTFGVEEKVAIAIGLAILSAVGLFVRIIGRRTELSKNEPMAKVIFYRLLFDRDIADRKLWNSRAIANQG